MNNVILCGRLTAEPDKKYSAKNPDMAVVKYTLAIDMGYGDKKTTEYVNCTAFGKGGEFVSTYFHKGQRVLVSGYIHTSVSEKDGKKSYYTGVITNTHEFADGKKEVNTAETNTMDGFTDIPNNAEDDQLISF